MKNSVPVTDIIEHCNETLSENPETLTVVHVSVLLWKSVMNSIEWNKKEDLLAEQALRHLQVLYNVVMTTINDCVVYRRHCVEYLNLSVNKAQPK